MVLSLLKTAAALLAECLLLSRRLHPSIWCCRGKWIDPHTPARSVLSRSAVVSPLGYKVDNFAREVYKTRFSDLQLSTTPLTNGCAAKTTWSSLALSVPSRCFSSSSDACFVHVHLLLQYSHTLQSTFFQIWWIWRPQLRWDKFWSFFLWQRSGCTCVMNISSYTR